MKYLGVVEKSKYTNSERLILVEMLAEMGGDLYVFGNISWAEAHKPISKELVSDYHKIIQQCHKFKVQSWPFLKPGDFHYCKNKIDRASFVDNVKKIMEIGPDGFFLLMDDMHTTDPKSRLKDAMYHVRLIEELCDSIGQDQLKGVCFQQYSGLIPEQNKIYWSSFQNILPSACYVTWTGPRSNNAFLNKEMLQNNYPDLDNPILFWDNLFASDSNQISRSPIRMLNEGGREYKLEGRENLNGLFDCVLINLSDIFSWNINHLYSAVQFWRYPESFCQKKSSEDSIVFCNQFFLDRSMQNS